MEKYLELGQIVNTFGIRGQVKVKPFTDDIKKFDTFKEIFVEKKNQLQLFQIEKVNYSKGMVILKLKGIETPEQAETLRNCYIKMDRKNAKKLPEGTYYIADLIGLDVYSDEEELLGKVDYIYNTGSSDIYVVKNDEGKEILLPAIKDVLKQVDLENKKISDVLPDSFWETNFWLYWQTMFAFQKWSSALEMKRYLCRYVHHIDGLPDFSALRFTKYNQYESMILPLTKYLESNGVKIEYGIDVKNVIFESKQNKKVATQIIYENKGLEKTIDLIEDDLVFITNGCCTDTSCYGDQNNAPDLSKIKNGNGESWDLWKNIASQASNGEFGNPDKFCGNVDLTNWMSATIEVSDENIIKHIIDICKRDPRKGKVTTGGIVTVKDSTENWYLSWTINRQPQFKSQNKNSVLVWVYALNTTKPGNFIEKAIKTCTGKEICEEWLYHIGIPTNEIEKYADKCNTTTCYMPYINAFFQPREEKDRPLVVPKESINFAFVGQFAETPRDTIFTTEYSIRTGMEAVYTLLKIDRAVPEVWGSKYDVRELLKACYYAVDKKSVDELPLTFAEKQAIKIVEKKIKGTDLEILFKESGLFK